MNVEYKMNYSISAEEFRGLLVESGLGERRPIDDSECLEGMISNSNLMVSAWSNEQLIGLARCMTDFHYACYLSDLAVSNQYQKSGIGKKLQSLVVGQLGPRCKLILIAAPSAHSYYEYIGFRKNSRCWVMEAGSNVFS